MRLAFNKPPSFAETIRAGKLERSYTFGLGLDLARDWQPLQDFTGAWVINNEVQRYPVAFDDTSHRLTPSSLELTATAPAWRDAPTQAARSAAKGETAVRVASTIGISPGMLCVPIGATYGYYWVQSAQAGVVTVDAPMYFAAGTTLVFLAVYRLVPNAPVSGALVIPADAVPAGIAPGMVLHDIYGGTFGETVVTDASARSVTLSRGVSVGPASLIAFSPLVRCGQIWSRFAVQPPGPGETVALELEAAIPPTSITGSWPAFWLYSKDDGRQHDASEIDVFEFFNSDTGGNGYTGYNHGEGVGAPSYRRPGAWDAYDVYRDPLTDYGARVRRWGLVWTARSVAKWVDGSLVKEDAYRWTSQCAAQIGINVSAGSLTPNFLSNGMVPRTAASFPYSFSLRSLNVWRY